MGWGLEARVPFLDHELVELAAACPPELKLAAGGALVAAGGAAACWELRLLQASMSGNAASAPPVARVHFRNDRRLTWESCSLDILGCSCGRGEGCNTTTYQDGKA